jgi:hypothetical protein
MLTWITPIRLKVRVVIRNINDGEERAIPVPEPRRMDWSIHALKYIGECNKLVKKNILTGIMAYVIIQPSVKMDLINRRST